MAPKPLPPEEYLNKLFRYEPDTGALFWRESRGNVPCGGRAGTIASNGYIVVVIDGIVRKAHRVIWKMAFGEEPAQIDHINRRRDDNRLSNLRASNNSMNGLNKPPRRDLPVGVYPSKTGRWRACLTRDFDTQEEAVAARERWLARGKRNCVYRFTQGEG